MPATPFSKIKIASICILAYSSIVLFGALRAYYTDDMADSLGLSKAIVRTLAMSGIAFWILSTSKYSWYFAVCSCGVFGFIGLFGLGLFVLMPISGSDINYVTLTQLIIGCLCLLTATFILITKDVRQLFR